MDGTSLIPNAMTGYYSSSRILPLLMDKHALLYAEKGIRAVLSKTTVNFGQPIFRDFLWIELIDEAVANGYEPDQAILKNQI